MLHSQGIESASALTAKSYMLPWFVKVIPRPMQFVNKNEWGEIFFSTSKSKTTCENDLPKP